jgi:hypothetical protein
VNHCLQDSDTEWTDYERLHAAMEGKGFSRLIRSRDGKLYHLPWAEYNASADLSSAQVRDIAGTAANTTGKKDAVLVTQSVSRAWTGLEDARRS